MITNRKEFQCRFYVIGDDVYELRCWSFEIEPMTYGLRSTEDWATEHMSNYDAKQLRELFTLSKDSDYQVVFKGEMVGSGPDFNGEYDEEMEPVVIVTERIPVEFAEVMVAGYCDEIDDRVMDEDTIIGEMGDRLRAEQTVMHDPRFRTIQGVDPTPLDIPGIHSSGDASE